MSYCVNIINIQLNLLINQSFFILLIYLYKKILNGFYSTKSIGFLIIFLSFLALLNSNNKFMS